MEWCTDEDRERILEVGFEWDEFGDGFRWDDVVAGLTLYNALYGELPDDDFQVRVALVGSFVGTGLLGPWFVFWDGGTAVGLAMVVVQQRVIFSV